MDQLCQGGELRWEIVLAVSVVTTLPMVLLLVIGQRLFGIVTTGRTGA